MAQLINIRLNRPDNCPLGFRLQGGKDFGTPLVIQKVNGGSPAEKAGLQAGDSVIKVNTTEVFSLRHKEAQDVIVRAGQNFDITVQRGGSTWKPSVTPVGSMPSPSAGKPFNSISPVTQTSLKANQQPVQHIGSGYNSAAKPFNYMNGNGDTVKSIVNKQYNTPVGIYSEETIAETLSAQAEVLAGGVLGVNFKKNEKIYDAEKSEVFKMLQEADNEPEPEASIQTPTPGTVTGLRHVTAPVTRPDAPANNTGGLPPGQNICEECERLIIGVFVRIKDKNLHVECFKCATCGSSLKNQGYYNLNGKLYCDIHAKMVARQNPPAPNLEPVTVLPKLPSSTISSALSSHSMPLPPLSSNLPSLSGNGPAPFSPSSNISGPKPFGAPISPVAPPSACSISPRSMPSMTSSAPISPASTLQRPMQQAPAAQPLPVKSVKNIVWPPKNPPDDEEPEEEPSLPFHVPPTTGPSPKPYRTEPAPQMTAPWLVKQSRSDPDSHHVKFSDHVQEKIMDESSSFKTIEGENSMTSSSVQMSAISSHSSSIAQSSQKSIMTESCMKESVASSQKSSVTVNESRQMSECAMQKTIYQSQTGEPIQTTYNPPLPDSTTKALKELKSEYSSESKTVEETQMARHKESICSAEVSNITERKSPMECVETIGEAIDCQNLVLSLTPGNITPRPPSPTPEDVCSPIIEKKSFEEGFEEIKNAEKITSTSSEVSTVAEHNSKINIESEICKIESNQVCEKKSGIIKTEQKNNNGTSSELKGYESPLITALTIAPERSYSPLPPTTTAPIVPSYNNNNIMEPRIAICPFHPPIEETLIEPAPVKPVLVEPAPVETAPVTNSAFTESECPSKKLFSSIPPIKPFIPKPTGESVPMPEQTVPYIPPDFCIKVEPKPIVRAVSPFVEALTVAPERPYTPLGTESQPCGTPTQSVERGSLVKALTIAPERPFTPANDTPTMCPLQTMCKKPQASASQECIKPIATQPSQTCIMQTSRPPVQTICQIQSTQSSAFKPVVKTVQTFPPPPPEEFAGVLPQSFPPVSDKLKSQYNVQQKSESMTTESSSFASHQVFESHQSDKKCTQSVSSSKSEYAVCAFEKKEKLTSSAKRETSGLHKPETLPCYQVNLEQLPSQRGKTPEVINEPPILQRPVTPIIAQESSDPHVKKVQHSQQIESSVSNQTFTTSMQTHTTSILKSSHASQRIADFHGDVPISMTFQPVTEDMYSRTTPTIRSRPMTPSMINKPAPLIPFYQMNLVSVEHNAPDTNLFEPSSPEVSRSPTPKLRSRSPAVGPPPNPLKAHAPRMKDEVVQQHPNHTLLAQATSNLRKEHDVKTNFQSGVEVYNASGAKNWIKDQQSVVSTQQQMSKIGFHHTENISDSNVHTSISEASYMNQQNMQQKSESQATYETGSSSVQRTKKVFEEFERTQSAKVVEIQKHSGGIVTKSVSQIPSTSESTSMYQNFIRRSSESNTNQNKSLDYNTSASVCQQPCTVTNSLNQANVFSKCQSTYNPFTSSGANNKISGPVCDPTPSAGAAGGGPGRGKTFGVSSAPKRGRGILNKAAGPGTRIALCAHCNGQIRGPFITALGRIWCPEHFVCVNNTCRRQLQDIGFVEENGQLYCEYCFEQFIAPACDKCHAKIKGDCLNAIGKHFHPECFNCAYCGKLFGNNPFFLEEGLPYCEADWNELFTTKCFACGFPVEAGDRWVEALNNNYHSQCFNCTMCKKNLEGQSFYAKGGRPFCKNHAR